MAVRTHDSKWRLLVAGAPLLGVAFIVLAALQGEPEVARSRTVMEILVGVAALGVLVAWWTAYQLRAAPAVPVALAQAGQVALGGRAQALPGAAPLTSPDGVACLWFKHSQQAMHQYNASDSVRPFLLVDDTGQCIVLPAGADVTGSSRQLPQSDVKQLPEVKDITAPAPAVTEPAKGCCGKAKTSTWWVGSRRRRPKRWTSRRRPRAWSRKPNCRAWSCTPITNRRYKVHRQPARHLCLQRCRRSRPWRCP